MLVGGVWYAGLASSPLNQNMPLDVVVLAFEHVETLVRQRPVGQQSLNVIHNHLSERAQRTK